MSHVPKGDLHAYLDGALGAYPEVEADRIRRHLEDCAQCAESLDEERQLRLVVAEILEATADAPVDLAPFEELVARAGELEGARVTGRVSRVRTLRMAATVVISLGAGWVARDLRGPAENLVTTRPNAVVTETEEGVAFAAEDAANPFSVEPVEGEVGQNDFNAQPAAPVTSLDLDAEAVPAVARTALPEASSSPPGRGAVPAPDERTGAADAVFTDQVAGPRDVVGDGIRSDLQRAPDAGPQATDAPRRRLEAAPADLRDNRAPSLAARGMAAAVLDEEVAKSGLEAPFTKERDEVAQDESSVTGGSASLIVPGLSIRDVRLLDPAPARGATVVVVQELADGRAVELWFRMDSDDVVALGVAGSMREEAESRSLDRLQQSRELDEGPLPAGWRRVTRPVNGGVAVIRGPLSEEELSALLDAAVGGR